MKTYILQKNQKGRDKWLYTIIDSDGNICASRTSKREYVAATIDGQFFFGRRDLVGCGDHGKALAWARQQMHATMSTYLEEIHSSRKWASKSGYNPDEYVARLKERMGSPEEWIEKMHASGRDLLDRMQVAYFPAIN